VTFAINTATGALTVKDNLDHETLPLVPLTVVVSDGGGLFDLVFINVIIQDINEPPTISDANLFVSELVPIGTIVGTAQASDPDDSSEPFGTLIYLKIPGTTHDSFTVDPDTGEIRTKTLLDHETAPLIGVTIGVFDGGGLSATANIFVSILDANEAPVADDAIFNVSENLPVGALVGTVSASDQDTTAPSNTLAYAITGGNVGSAFNIDPNTGELSTLTPLDFNATPIYNLAVTVTDGGGLTDIANVTVNVADAVVPSDISEIDGTNGFALTGFAPNGWVTIPGDMNGDGIDDFAISDPNAEVGGNTQAGSVYVVYGTIDAAPPEFDLPTLAASDGFRFDGSGSGDFTGFIMNGAGDINNDGFADLVISAQGAFNAENDSNGRVYVVFGGPQIPSVVSADDLNGVNGFRVINTPLESGWAFAVSSIGGINGDGIDDFGAGSITGSIDDNNSHNGKVYAVFGRDIPNGDPNFDPVLDLTSLDATTGMVLFGAPGDSTGFFINPTGDINGDTFGDFVITSASATFRGLYVVFGNLQTNVPLPSDLPSFDLTTLDGTNGFVINAPSANTMIGGNGGGDINGDGHADLAVASPNQEVNGLIGAGVTYAIFGTDSNFVWPASFDLASLDGTNGFRIVGDTANGDFGFPLDNRSDIDGDGLDDIVAAATVFPLIGSGDLPPPPLPPSFYYLIAGSNLPYPATIDLSTLDPAVGNRIGVANNMDFMSAAGDVNGDGLGDILLSAGNDTSAHVVFGGDFLSD
jgi:hypothetical protein